MLSQEYEVFAMIAQSLWKEIYWIQHCYQWTKQRCAFSNNISLIYSDCTAVNNSKGGGVLIVITSQYPLNIPGQSQKLKLKKNPKMYWSKDCEDINAVIQGESANLKRF